MFDSILKKYREELLDGKLQCLLEKRDEKEDALSKIKEDSGSGFLCFSDINYEGQDRASWDACRHLYRLKSLSLAYKKGDGCVKLETLHSLLDFWFERDPICSNWWYNMIGAAGELGTVGVLLWDELDGERRILLLSRLSRGVIFTRNAMSPWNLFNGANMLWVAFITMTYAILARDASLFKLSVKLAEGEADFSEQGMQPDGSFFQHGKRLYSGGYGRSYIKSLAPLIHFAGMTPYAFSNEKLENVMTHVFGIKYMMNRGHFDHVATGREYVRRGDPMSVGGLIPALELIADTPDCPRLTELLGFIDALKKGGATFDGVRLFERAAYLTMCKDGVFISHKSAAPDILNAEIINSENVLGYNFSYGTHTAVLSTGTEYVRAIPAYDYGLIPGTSMPYMTEEELLAVEDFSKRAPLVENYKTFSDGDVAMTRTTVTHEGVSATVAAFATPYGMIILGNSLSDDQGRKIVTTVEQCAVSGEVNISQEELIHGSVRYRILDGKSKLVGVTERKKGSYHRNSLFASDEVFECDMLTVTLDRNGFDSYAYVIAPVSADIDGISVIRNDKSEQSVKLPDGRVLSLGI